MSQLTFSEEETIIDGNVWKVGQGIKLWDDAPFGTAIILGFAKSNSKLKLADWAKVARPYCFVSGSGTTCPTALTGVETIEIHIDSLARKDRISERSLTI